MIRDSWRRSRRYSESPRIAGVIEQAEFAGKPAPAGALSRHASRITRLGRCARRSLQKMFHRCAWRSLQLPPSFSAHGAPFYKLVGRAARTVCSVAGNQRPVTGRVIVISSARDDLRRFFSDVRQFASCRSLPQGSGAAVTTRNRLRAFAFENSGSGSPISPDLWWRATARESPLNGNTNFPFDSITTEDTKPLWERAQTRESAEIKAGESGICRNGSDCRCARPYE